MGMKSRPKRATMSNTSLMLMGIPRRFCDTSVEEFNTYGDRGLVEVKKFVKKYISELQHNIRDNRGIFFYGSNGVGKSMLASIILKEAYRNRFTGRRTTFSQYISYYTEAWNVYNKAEKDVLETDFYEKYKGVEVLVLEEIGKEIDSKIAKPILEDLLRYREEKGLVTIMCSNISPKVLSEVYGTSVMSIIKGSMTPIKIVGKDRREEVYNEFS